MRDYMDDRVLQLAEHIITTGETVRQTANKFGISKSTVHKDVTTKLQDMNKTLFEEVRAVLDTNKSERHMRGGLATKAKYEELKENAPKL